MDDPPGAARCAGDAGVDVALVSGYSGGSCWRLRSAALNPSQAVAEARLRWWFLLGPVLVSEGCGAQEQRARDGAPAIERFERGGARVSRAAAGAPAPVLLFQDPAREPASLADFRGRPVLLNLWATWCGPCVAEMPTLDALAAGRPDLQVLAVSQDLYGEEKVNAFFAERGYRALRPFVDPERTLMRQLRIDTLPTTILYDAAGREVWRVTGREDWRGDRAAALLAEAAVPARPGASPPPALRR